MSFSVVSLIAMVPESECRMPTLMVSWALADGMAASRPSVSPVARSQRRAIGRSATARMEWIIAMSLCVRRTRLGPGRGPRTLAHRKPRANAEIRLSI